MRSFIVALLFTLAAILSCRKNDNGKQPGKPVVDFMKLKTGNYWVYETFTIRDTAATHYGWDSLFVASDTVFDDRRYFVLKISQNGSPAQLYRYVRDSGQYVLDRHQGIIFSSRDFGVVFDTLYVGGTVDTVATVTTEMTDKDFVGSYPAGIYSTYTFREHFTVRPPYDSVLTSYARDMRYARDVGMVFEEYGFYVQTKSHLERRLARYKVR